MVAHRLMPIAASFDKSVNQLIIKYSKCGNSKWNIVFWSLVVSKLVLLAFIAWLDGVVSEILSSGSALRRQKPFFTRVTDEGEAHSWIERFHGYLQLLTNVFWSQLSCAAVAQLFSGQLQKSLLSDSKVRVSSKNLNGKERMGDACFGCMGID